MFDITIGNQVISLPDVNEDPNWAQGLVEAFQAIAAALQSLIGTGDVVPQVYTMVANNNSDVVLPSLSFANDIVRGAAVRYAIIRTTDTNSEAEYGNLELIFNESASVGNKWQMSREFVGSSTVTFAVDDNGEVSFSSATLSGANHTGKISFAAQALLQDY